MIADYFFKAYNYLRWPMFVCIGWLLISTPILGTAIIGCAITVALICGALLWLVDDTILESYPEDYITYTLRISGAIMAAIIIQYVATVNGWCIWWSPKYQDFVEESAPFFAYVWLAGTVGYLAVGLEYLRTKLKQQQ